MKLLKCFQDKTLLLFMVLCLSIFLKSLLFHYLCFDYIAISSLWQNPTEFLAFYFAKLSPAIFIGSFVFISKKHHWTIVLSFIIDFWFISNYIYFRANDLFLDYDTIIMVGNMEGFWPAVFTYCNWGVLFFIIISILYSIYVFRNDKLQTRSFSRFMVGLLVVIILIGYDFAFGYGKTNKLSNWQCNMYQGALKIAQGNCAHDNLMSYSWVENGNVFRYFPASIVYYIAVPYYHSKDTKNVELTEKEMFILYDLINHTKTIEAPNNNLIVILVESLESWCISLQDSLGNSIAPNLDSFSKCNNVLYASKIRSQAQRGSSGDGQMIINTGLLPTKSGAACMLYGKNVYPNFAHLYNSYVINPAPRTWNQPVVSKSYGYKQTIIPIKSQITFDDAVINEMAKDQLQKCKNESFCILDITASTHSPFTHVRRNSLQLPNEMPEVLKNYLQAVHYADSCIGDFISCIRKDSLLKNTTIVITGDHTVFKSTLLNEFQDFSKKYKFPIPTKESYCPLIIYSPNIQERIEVDDLCFQMDVFPTILHCIGVEGYYWKGFGVNLLDTIARHNRKITEEDAYILSDKLIRSNYFSKLAF